MPNDSGQSLPNMNLKFFFSTSLGLFLSLSALSYGASPMPSIDGLFLHLDASKVAARDGETVTSWTDTVGEEVLTGSATYVADYTNGQPGLRFDGNSDSLGTRHLADGPDTSNLTLFIVGNFATEGNDEISDYLVSAQHPTAADNRLRILKRKDDGKISVAVGGSSTEGVSLPADTDVHVFGLVSGRNGNQVDFLLDGAVIRSYSHSHNNAALQGLFLGAYRGLSHFFEGTIAEVLLYDRALEESEVDEVAKYLLSRYEIQP
jgi:hypothetical protein